MSNEKIENQKKLNKKKTYKKPILKSERILEAGLAITCNGTTSAGRKASTPACNSARLKT